MSGRGQRNTSRSIGQFHRADGDIPKAPNQKLPLLQVLLELFPSCPNRVPRGVPGMMHDLSPLCADRAAKFVIVNVVDES